MRWSVASVGTLVWLALAGCAAAQDRAWVQIEAQPTEGEAAARARAYAGAFPNVGGYEMETGWFAIALGPFGRAAAEAQLQSLKRERLIPSDSYLAFGDSYLRQFWPEAGGPPAALPDSDAASSVPLPEATAAPLPDPRAADETPTEARASEALLSGEDREGLQRALQWQGYYAGKIDGAIGSGTRRSMADWQGAMGYEPTGVLTTAQRAALLEAVEAERASVGLVTMTESEAGIAVLHPSALVEFDRYEPPFVHYRPLDKSGYRMLLISEAGDATTLAALFEMMQTLQIVPEKGERKLSAKSFVLTGKGPRLQSHTEAYLDGGSIKGFTLAWPPEDGARAMKIVDAMRASFRSLGSTVLDDSLGQPMAVDRSDLVSGLEVRRPERSRSGFWLDGSGLVATTTEVLAGCGRVTVAFDHPATILHEDAATGLAILKPDGAVAPRVHARLGTGPRIGSEVAVAGYSYEDALDTAVLTFGTYSAATGLDGESDRARVDLSARPGDAGGAVLDDTGSTIGMLLPRATGGTRVLPDDVGIVLPAAVIAQALAAIAPAPSAPAETLVPARIGPEDLTLLGRDLAVIVSCWE